MQERTSSTRWAETCQMMVIPSTRPIRSMSSMCQHGPEEVGTHHHLTCQRPIARRPKPGSLETAISGVWAALTEQPSSSSMRFGIATTAAVVAPVQHQQRRQQQQRHLQPPRRRLQQPHPRQRQRQLRRLDLRLHRGLNRRRDQLLRRGLAPHKSRAPGRLPLQRPEIS